MWCCGNVYLCKRVFVVLLKCVNVVSCEFIVDQKHEERGYYLRVLRVIH